MQKSRLTLAAAALVATLPFLQGCVPAVIVGGAAAGVMTAHDRRSTGTQTDDETAEWKAMQSIPAQYKEMTHANFTAYNRRLLITGEAPSEEAKSGIEAKVRMIDGLREVYNELGIGPASSLGSRSTDSFITSKVKARLVDTNQVSANHIKVVTERGIAVNDHLPELKAELIRRRAPVKDIRQLLRFTDPPALGLRIKAQGLRDLRPVP